MGVGNGRMNPFRFGSAAASPRIILTYRGPAPRPPNYDQVASEENVIP